MASVGGELCGYLFDDLKRSLEDDSSLQGKISAQPPTLIMYATISYYYCNHEKN